MTHIDPGDATIFLVDDNPDHLFIVSDILRGDLGVKSFHARVSGRQLFKLLHRSTTAPDLILLDIFLPYEDGFTIHRQVRAYCAEHQVAHPPLVVAISANCLPETVARIHQEGFDGFLGKPIERSRFIQQIRRILSGDPVWEPHTNGDGHWTRAK